MIQIIVTILIQLTNNYVCAANIFLSSQVLQLCQEIYNYNVRNMVSTYN